ncbi:MAG: hypothetical protein ACPGU1_18605 [Myxococcota bacterium]
MTGTDPTPEHLPGDIAALLADSGDAPAPVAVRERILERVQASVATPGASTSNDGGAVTGAVSGHGVGAAIAVLGAVLVVGAFLRPGQGPPVSEVVAGVTLVESKDAPTARGVRLAATPMKAAPTQRVETSPLMSNTPVPAPVVVTPNATEPVPGHSSAVPASPPKAPLAASKPMKATPTKAPMRDLAAERKLLDRARAALGSRDQPGALRIVRSHRAKYPRGALVEERESLWVRGLLESGQVAPGVKRGERFLKRFPRSIHRGAVERALERAQR